MDLWRRRGFDEDEFPWDREDSPNAPPFSNNEFRRPRYADAYGDYRGGYGPGGGFGPRPGPPPLMPPSLMPPPGCGGPGIRPGLMRPRGYGPGPQKRSPEVTMAIKFLMRCGVLKEHLKNMPHEILSLIQPEHCGLCGLSFDSFIMSRMHYVSKNHAKHVKKMLSKSNSGASNEMPFKARELYCELCDIQITSKVHGDAHYEGKPHRGIVEGRKMPKNPLLLQPHMQGRLEQLIRREKRCLKPAKECAEGADGEKEAKNVSPELYCDICKTTVTCTEQMTMHMNGKRHLSKEKHHILTMMKGQADDTEQEPNDEEEDEMDGDGEAAAGDGEGDAQKEGDNADWGNEQWDENQDGAADA